MRYGRPSLPSLTAPIPQLQSGFSLVFVCAQLKAIPWVLGALCWMFFTLAPGWGMVEWDLSSQPYRGIDGVLWFLALELIGRYFSSRLVGLLHMLFDRMIGH
uniref:Uncharacterized protein n=1 Tax=Arundo donax TaxID=35708 RepID=A0A0A9GS54_ARUDO